MKKVSRCAGLLIIAVALLTGTAKKVTATAPVTCWSVCSGHPYYGQCWADLATCCSFNRVCPDPWEFQTGDCTDGSSYCPIPP